MGNHQQMLHNSVMEWLLEEEIQEGMRFRPASSAREAQSDPEAHDYEPYLFLSTSEDSALSSYSSSQENANYVPDFDLFEQEDSEEEAGSNDGHHVRNRTRTPRPILEVTF